MKKILLLLFFPFSLFAQSSWNVWVDNCGAPGANVPVKMIKTNDNAVVVLLQCLEENNVTGMEVLTPILKKYNSNGDFLWEKKYYNWLEEGDSTIQTGLEPRDIIQLPSGDFVLCGGLKNIPQTQDFVLQLSSGGDSLLLKSYTYYRIHRLQYYQDEIFFRGVNISQQKVVLGNLNWPLNEITEVVNDDLLKVFSFIIDDNGNFITADGLPNSNHSWYQKYSIEGELLEDKYYEEGIGFFLALSSDGFPVAYASDLAKFDESLEIQWEVPHEDMEFVSTGGVDQDGRAIITTSDGGFLVGGHFGSISLGWPYYKVFLIKLDSEGVMEWGYGYGIPVNILFDVVETDDGYIFLAAEEADGDIWLVKVDEEGIFTSAEEVPQIDITNIHLYPNPCTDILNIKTFKTMNGKIEVFDLSGRLFDSFEIDHLTEYSIDVSHLEQGFYYLRYFDEFKQDIETVKFIKH